MPAGRNRLFTGQEGTNPGKACLFAGQPGEMFLADGTAGKIVPLRWELFSLRQKWAGRNERSRGRHALCRAAKG